MDAHSHAQARPPALAGSTLPLDIQNLTRRMAAGDESAYRQFYDAYFDRLARYLLVVANGDEQGMREALQGALVRVVRHIKVFTEEAQFWTWLSVLARSAFIDETRKRGRYLGLLGRFTEHARAGVVAAHSSESDDRLQLLLESAVAMLPPEERQLVERKYFERCSVRDLAAEFGTTEKAIESRLVRIRRRIKEAVLARLKHDETQ